MPSLPLPCKNRCAAYAGSFSRDARIAPRAPSRILVLFRRADRDPHAVGETEGLQGTDDHAPAEQGGVQLVDRLFVREGDAARNSLRSGRSGSRGSAAPAADGAFPPRSSRASARRNSASPSAPIPAAWARVLGSNGSFTLSRFAISTSWAKPYPMRTPASPYDLREGPQRDHVVVAVVHRIGILAGSAGRIRSTLRRG